jgi:hypothetical protein
VLVLYVFPKPLVLAVALSLRERKWNHLVLYSETYSPCVMHCQLLFLPSGTLARDFPICISMELEERDRIHLCSIRIRPTDS